MEEGWAQRHCKRTKHIKTIVLTLQACFMRKQEGMRYKERDFILVLFEGRPLQR